MTDNEIMEQLTQFLETGYCTRKWSDRECAILILSLIKRQKEKIEELEKGELSKAMTFNSDTIKRCSAEAIREFAEKFKSTLENLEANSPNKTYQTAMQDMLDYYVPKIIDNLVKEMTEATDEIPH